MLVRYLHSVAPTSARRFPLLVTHLEYNERDCPITDTVHNRRHSLSIFCEIWWHIVPSIKEICGHKSLGIGRAGTRELDVLSGQCVLAGSAIEGLGEFLDGGDAVKHRG